MTLTPPLITLTGVGVLHNTSRQSLETSQKGTCGNLWRISNGRLHFVSCLHPPAIHNQLSGLSPQGVVITRRMIQRSPFQEGEDGIPRTATSNPSTSVTRWRLGSSTTSTAPAVCSIGSRCGASHQYISNRFAFGYPQN